MSPTRTPHPRPHPRNPQAEPINTTEGEPEAAVAPVPCACVPLTLLGKPAYQHVRAEEEMIRGYMKAFGERSMTYVHFHRSHKHYEVRIMCMCMYVYVYGLWDAVAPVYHAVACRTGTI